MSGSNDDFQWAGGTGSFSDPNQWIDLTNPGSTGTTFPGGNATATLTSGTITDNGAAGTITVAGTMTLRGQVGGQQVTNTGTVTLGGTASEFGGNTLDNQGFITGAGLVFAGSIDNSGTISAGQLQGTSLDNTGALAIGGISSLGIFDNAATASIGAFANVQAMINTGALTIDSGAQATFNALTGNGTLNVDDGSGVTITASADIAGAITASGVAAATFTAPLATIEPGATVQGANLQLSIGTLFAYGGAVVNVGGLVASGTIFSGASVATGGSGAAIATLTVAGVLQAAGALNIGDAVSVPTGGSIAVTGGGNVDIAALSTFSLAGQMNTGTANVLDNGLVQVQGTGALWSGTQQLTIGLSSQGTFAVGSGASASGRNVILGAGALHTGLGIVDGAAWSNSGSVDIGSKANGVLHVQDAGTFTAGGDMNVSASGVTGTVTVDGAAALLQAGALEVNAGGTVTVTNGASLATGAARGIDALALFPSGTVAATVELQSGAVWTSAGGIEVGLGTIALAGGTLQSAAMQIGAGGTNVTASLVSVTGPQSQWIDTGNIVVGVSAAGTLALAAGAILEAPADLIAGQGAGGNGTITDDGLGTALAVEGNLVIGQGGAGLLAVTNGATLAVGGTLQVGGSIGVGTVTDTGDGFRHFGALAIDNGVAHVAPGIVNAWNVDLGSAQNIDVGGVAGGSGTLDVVATGTVIAGSGTVTVGAAGDGTLALAANALFDAPVNAITIGGASGSNGLVTLDGAGAILAGGAMTIGASGGAGTLDVGAGGSALVASVLAGTNGVVSISGSLEVQGSLTGGGTIGMAGGFLHLDAPGSVSAAVGGFAPGDTIDLKGVDAASVSFAAGTLSFAGGGFALSVSRGTVQALASADGAAVVAFCFCAGARILTDAGEVAVEALRPGMRVVSLAHQRALPVRWIGSRTVARASPVRIAAGAFGGGAPHRALNLSPDHAVYVEGALIPIRYLINGASIAPVRREAETYFHVELDAHGVLLAEGLPAESYLDTGNRAALHDSGHMRSRPIALTDC